MEKLLQRLVADTQSRQSVAVSPPEPVGLRNLVRSYLSGQQTSGPQIRQRPIRRDRNGLGCFSCVKSGYAATQSVPSRISVMLVKEAIAGDTPRLGCPCNEQSERLLAGVAQPARVTVSENSLGLSCVGGTLSPSRIYTDLEVTNAPELSSGGPPSVPSRILVVLVEEAKTGGTPRRECPRDDQDIRSLAGVAKPAGVTVYDDSIGSPCVGGRCPLQTLLGGSFR